jgi:cytochrome bd-type quinol oxidase subunit 1
MDPAVQVRQRWSHLPLLRFTSVAIVLMALDSIVCISLWIAGGDSLYLEDSVEKFSLTHSTFDLACIAAVRSVLLVTCFYFLEHYSLLKVSVLEHDKQRRSYGVVVFCQLGMFTVSGGSFVYSVVKGSLILKHILQGSRSSELDMHVTYKILSIVSIVFPAMELIFCVISLYCIRRMIRHKKLRLLVNLDNGDYKTVAKKRPDIKRVLLLAKPVRI